MSWPGWWQQTRAWPTRLLSPLGRAVCGIARQRRRQFEQAFMPTLPTAVIVVVGNVTVGGSGKTPLIMRLGEALAQAGIAYGIVSRGYGGKAADYPLAVRADCDPGVCGDEPCLLARRLGVPVVVAPQRMAAVAHLLQTHPQVQVILSDDGLQHFALPRDLAVVVADGQRGFGNGHCLPAGPLREPLAVLDQVDFRLCNGVSEDPRLVDWPVMRLQPQYWVNSQGEQQPLTAFCNRPVNALAGIGNPQRFFDQLVALGIRPLRTWALPDHAAPALIEKTVAESGIWLMTEKDAIKCPDRDNVWALVVRPQLPSAWLNAWLDAVKTRLKVKYES